LIFQQPKKTCIFFYGLCTGGKLGISKSQGLYRRMSKEFGIFTAFLIYRGERSEFLQVPEHKRRLGHGLYIRGELEMIPRRLAHGLYIEKGLNISSSPMAYIER